MRRRRFATVLLTGVTAALITAGPDALAQLDQLKNTTPEQRAKIQTDMMKTKLTLTPEQTSAIGAINEKYAKQMEPIIKGTEGPFAKMRQMRQVSQAKEAELKAALSPAQFQKYLAEKEEMREQFEEKLLH
jgi:LTXXQ motif family protein